MNRVVILALILGVSGNLGHPMESPSASSAFLSKTNKYQTSEPAPRILGRNRDNGDDEEVDRAKRSSGSTVPLVVFQNGVPTIVKHDDGTPVMLGEDDQNNIEVTKREAEQAETTEDGQPIELLNDDGTPVVYKENQNRQKRSFNEDFFDDFVELGGDEFSFGTPNFHRTKRDTIQTTTGIPLVVFQDGQLKVVKKSDGSPLTIEEAEGLAGNKARVKRSPGRKGRRGGKRGRVNISIEEHVFVLKPTHGHGHGGYGHHHGHGHDHHFVNKSKINKTVDQVYIYRFKARSTGLFLVVGKLSIRSHLVTKATETITGLLGFSFFQRLKRSELVFELKDSGIHFIHNLPALELLFSGQGCRERPKGHDGDESNKDLAGLWSDFNGLLHNLNGVLRASRTEATIEPVKKSIEVTSDPAFESEPEANMRELVKKDSGLQSLVQGRPVEDGLEYPAKISSLEGVESGQDTGASHATEDIGSGSLHHGHEAFVLEDLHTAVQGVLVLHGGTGGHHHATTDGVNGIGHETGGHGHTPAQDEGEEHAGVVTQKDGLQGIVKTEVHATVDEDTHAGDDETAVQSGDTVRGQSLPVDVDESVELALATLLAALGVVSQTSTGIIQRVDEGQRHGTGKSSGQDVLAELLDIGGVLLSGEHALDGVLEGEVQGLCGEVSQHIGQVASPESVQAFIGQGATGAVHDTVVGLVQHALLQHLTLVLDQQLDTLNGGGSGLGHACSHTRQHEALEEAQLSSTFLVGHLDLGCFNELNRRTARQREDGERATKTKSGHTPINPPILPSTSITIMLRVVRK
ncbi:hypothetical protein TCAL_09361 [Tigriopus californicus]|uniref:Uncharacterized protein n=1 Tax=Tigriopus californicus TaxID=6832 RepID=A0A553PDW4_TIGCA|nr:hypothetical protein TCAL_09361 [Tigriopus californicus]